MRLSGSFSLVFTGTIISMALAAQAIAQDAPPRNVVLMVVDDQGLDAGCYGHPTAKTPHLDALAAAGTRFEYAFCTTASCSASRSVILSGLHNHANGQYGHMHGYNNFHTRASVRSLSLLLSDAGYRTCSIGKYHVQPEANYHFEHYGNEGIQGARNGARMADNARAFILQNDEQPFFLYFCTSDPHRARQGFANDNDYPGIEVVEYDAETLHVPDFLPDLPETRSELAEYYQAVSRADQALGELVDVLHETGHWDDTLLIYTSDNGMPFPGAKTNLYEPGMRLPLVVRRPSQEAGVVSKALVSFVDFVPTILEYCGAEGPAYDLHGRSLLRILEESDPPGWGQVFASHTFHEITMYYPMRVIRTARYKYILNLADGLPFPFASDLYASPTWQAVLAGNFEKYGARRVEDYIHRARHELYDLQSDPQEVINLADDPDHAEVLADLQQRLRAFQQTTGDPWSVKYRYE